MNVAALRLLVQFGVSLGGTGWVEALGFLETFGLYAAAVGALALVLPALLLRGKSLRAWSAGRLEPQILKEVDNRVDHTQVGIAW